MQVIVVFNREEARREKTRRKDLVSRLRR